ncbi:MAG: helix-turn-helix domain-containing protein [Sphingomonadales bacterium]|nr:helix-turn-helix domain-containing protein [Sphingomonadales bacterium]
MVRRLNPGNAPVGRRRSSNGSTLESLADRLRHTAMFIETGERSDELLIIAEQLSHLGGQQRRLAEELEMARGLPLWLLREKLGLPSPKAAQLLSLLLESPERLVLRSLIVQRLDTTPGSVMHLASQIRGCLAALGLRTELRSRDGGYRLSAQAAQRIKAYCGKGDAEPQRSGRGAQEQAAGDSDEAIPAASLAHGAGEETSHDPEAVSDLPDLNLLRETMPAPDGAGDGRSVTQEGEAAPRDRTSELMCLLDRCRTDSLKLMMVLLAYKGQFLTTAYLAEKVGCATSSVKVIVYGLRQQFKAHGLADAIESRNRYGYRMTEGAFLPLVSLGLVFNSALRG